MPDRFDTTQWTLILQAAVSQTEDGLAALDKLCRRYWKPLYAYACSRGYSHQDAEDVTQAFFQQLLARKTHMRAEREQGRFRTFLLHAMQNFVSNDLRNGVRLKRGGNRAAHLLVEDVVDELATHSTPETIYEKKWAQAVIAAAIESLRQEFTDAGHALRFDVLRPLLSVRVDGDSDALAARMGVSVANFRKILQNFRRSFGEKVRHEVRCLVSHPEEVDDEICCLMKALEG